RPRRVPVRQGGPRGRVRPQASRWRRTGSRADRTLRVLVGAVVVVGRVVVLEVALVVVAHVVLREATGDPRADHLDPGPRRDLERDRALVFVLVDDRPEDPRGREHLVADLGRLLEGLLLPDAPLLIAHE